MCDTSSAMRLLGARLDTTSSNVDSTESESYVDSSTSTVTFSVMFVLVVGLRPDLEIQVTKDGPLLRG